MKNKMMWVLLVCGMLGAFALGATGAVNVAGDGEGTGNSRKQDRLVGVFITTDYLNLMDAARLPGDGGAGSTLGSLAEGRFNEGRLYATLVDDPYLNPVTGQTVTNKKYVLEGIAGYHFLAAQHEADGEQYRGTRADDALADVKTAIRLTDEGEFLEITGTLYASTVTGPEAYYCNPVYQTPAGEVYVLSGDGMSFGGQQVAGMSGSKTMREEQQVTEKGKSRTLATTVTVNFCLMDTPTALRLLQFDQDNALISAREYAPDALPPEITPERETVYFLVETALSAPDGRKKVSRELFQESDQSLFAFFCQEDGICVKQSCAIDWESR